MKKFFAIILPIALITGAIYGYFATDIRQTMAYVSVDINPSVQFITDSDNIVTSVTASNEDGEVILLNEEDNLIGSNIEEATERIIELSIEHGYIDPDALETDPNAITVTTMFENANERIQERMQLRLKNNLDNYFKNNGIFAVVTDQDPQEIKTQADDLGVSPGNLRIMKSVQAVYPDFTTEQALNASIQELMQMLRDAREKAPTAENLQEQIDATQDEITQVNSQIDSTQINLDLAQSTLQAHETIDTTNFTDQELAIYNEQLTEYTQAVQDLQTELTNYNNTLSELQTELAELEQALAAKEQKITDRVNQAQQRRQAAYDKFVDWQQNKEQRSQQVRERWQEFKNRFSEEDVQGILDRLPNGQ
jgi:DNA repair exonuclease SbcCD ATPase subunit